ncbi:hypothetical protein NPIL_38351 [Nephila pilipes]|uniref:Uncharacterized protein n=1 Tax=Nephila pilipes TaxID=299642 RepID=A0A8X6QGW9_NEPPI|nr:hypothetical protein NPIL_258201 [Nephila pilipes]GFT65534.1 hypothetical protein NPIL_319841 [Nephila pilipes]GFU17942.1 hypothetical protein NPIL_682211 [Nephila pilipes]GFU58983.1 hypothetical protein NPIL_38351 [Nephila pilipes]
MYENNLSKIKYSMHWRGWEMVFATVNRTTVLVASPPPKYVSAHSSVISSLGLAVASNTISTLEYLKVQNLRRYSIFLVKGIEIHRQMTEILASMDTENICV